MTITANNLHGDFQLANGYGHGKAKEVLKASVVYQVYPFLPHMHFQDCVCALFDVMLYFLTLSKKRIICVQPSLIETYGRT